ncbi:MAG: FAD-binding domain-containing protein, partial [Bacteroidota bacterium]
MSFPTDITSIRNRLHQIDPGAYASSRNYLNGAVTRLSPYLSRGVISTRQVLQSLAERGFDFAQVEVLVRELAWREFFQRVWQTRNPDTDLRNTQDPVVGRGISRSIVHASTGIEAIDASIRTLMETGYMHNHCRMYAAALQCNIGQGAWMDGARWMYYHLLDGDWASNACSWQWVAGSFSSKKYYANQENINRYTGYTQRGTFLDTPYESFPDMAVPAELNERLSFELNTSLPKSVTLPENFRGKVYLYNYYNLDPTWCTQEEGLRILLLE